MNLVALILNFRDHQAIYIISLVFDLESDETS